jgi:hypothetical protein
MIPWNLAQLQEAVREIIVGHEQRGNVKVRIFIDAIDESSNDISETQPKQPLELLQWIDKLLYSAANAGADVRVCVCQEPIFLRMVGSNLRLDPSSLKITTCLVLRPLLHPNCKEAI